MPANREPIQKKRKQWEEEEEEEEEEKKMQQKKCTRNSSGLWRITVADLIQHVRLTIILQ